MGKKRIKKHEGKGEMEETLKEQVDHKLKNSLKYEDKEKVKAVSLKGVRFWIKLYNSLCANCKNNVRVNPKMSLEEYCEGCQSVINNFNN